ncbi:MAG: protein phosphatase CheZ [Candidatus Accumulibacter sp.]|jgi:chemotaxis protein CheZ|nr:protein phosphatase CheZ [Accumulibacter sp.]
MSDTESLSDSNELEALFDSIADKVWGASLHPDADAAPAPVRPTAEAPAPVEPPAQASAPSEHVSGGAPPVPPAIKDQMRRIAALFEAEESRDEDALDEEEGAAAREVAPLKPEAVVAAVPSFPEETEEHLRRVADLTAQLADKMRDTLGAFGPLCDDLEAKAASLAVRWDLLYANKISIEEFKRLASDTCMYLKNAVPQTMAKARQNLSRTTPLQESGVSASRLARDVLSHFQEFEARRADGLRKTDA